MNRALLQYEHKEGNFMLQINEYEKNANHLGERLERIEDELRRV